ncbi:MAG: hypothetical protein ACI4UX_01275 [Clostridia bacterium]
MKEVIMPTGKENVVKCIKAIGQELIKRADDIANDINMVSTIMINAVLTPEEVTNFNITKNYTAMFEDKEGK